jgi:hypothetical protein
MFVNKENLIFLESRKIVGYMGEGSEEEIRTGTVMVHSAR